MAALFLNILSMEEITEYDVQVANQIWTVLKSNISVMLSWGIDPHSIKAIKLGTQFHVQGFKLRGKVKVTIDEGKDLYEVSLIPDDDFKPIQTITDIYVDELLSTIDSYVEKVENYEERVKKEYSK